MPICRMPQWFVLLKAARVDRMETGVLWACGLVRQPKPVTCECLWDKASSVAKGEGETERQRAKGIQIRGLVGGLCRVRQCIDNGRQHSMDSPSHRPFSLKADERRTQNWTNDELNGVRRDRKVKTMDDGRWTMDDGRWTMDDMARRKKCTLRVRDGYGVVERSRWNSRYPNRLMLSI